MRASELREKTPKELEAELKDLLQEQFNLRMQLATGQLSNHTQIRRVRRDIARVRTVLTEKSRAQA